MRLGTKIDFSTFLSFCIFMQSIFSNKQTESIGHQIKAPKGSVGSASWETASLICSPHQLKKKKKKGKKLGWPIRTLDHSSDRPDLEALPLHSKVWVKKKKNHFSSIFSSLVLTRDGEDGSVQHGLLIYSCQLSYKWPRLRQEVTIPIFAPPKCWLDQFVWMCDNTTKGRW